MCSHSLKLSVCSAVTAVVGSIAWLPREKPPRFVTKRTGHFLGIRAMDPTTAVTALHADNFREGEHIRINPGHYGTYETIFMWQNHEIFMLTKKEEGHQ